MENDVLINLILGREGADEALRGDLANFISTQGKNWNNFSLSSILLFF